MAFDINKDKVIWEMAYNIDQEILRLQVKSYDGGAPKVCFFKENKYGNKPVYRLGKIEFQILGDNWSTISKFIMSYNPPEQKQNQNQQKFVPPHIPSSNTDFIENEGAPF